ncbi:MAG: hypothetical protein HYS80_00570 [Candidatus Aenigmarchaeota archaeon]|nr:hypothetical protein [Candidatus Aenigmarchaeota archaeon]
MKFKDLKDGDLFRIVIDSTLYTKAVELGGGDFSAISTKEGQPTKMLQIPDDQEVIHVPIKG